MIQSKLGSSFSISKRIQQTLLILLGKAQTKVRSKRLSTDNVQISSNLLEEVKTKLGCDLILRKKQRHISCCEYRLQNNRSTI